MEVDLVYLWCDDSDINWHQKRLQYREDNLDIQACCAGRFVQNDELKYSLRSVEKYAPWINHIYIISDQQTPEWLNIAHEKITMVNHEEIIDKRYLPLFNSSAIETGIPNIKNLKEHFIYMNDDMFFNAPLCEKDFFTGEGKPIWRLTTPKICCPPDDKAIENRLNGKAPTQYETRLLDMHHLAQLYYKKNIPLLFPHHNADAYRKSDFLEHNKVFKPIINHTLSHRFRQFGDWSRVLVCYMGLCLGQGEIKVIDEYRHNFKAWLKHYLLLGKKRNSVVISMKNKDYYRKLRRYRPKFFCLEDGEKVTASDRERGRAFLQEYFSQKSQFEI